MNTTQQTILIQHRTNMSFRAVLAEYENCVIRGGHLADRVNRDGVIRTGPGYLQWDLWLGNVELAERYCEKQKADKKMIWGTLGQCWDYAYVGGGGRYKDVEQFRQSITVQ